MDMSKLRYDTIEQIRAIAWVGNHGADGRKMDAIHDYVVRVHAEQPELAKEALTIMGRDGMGVDEPVDDAGLATYLRETS